MTTITPNANDVLFGKGTIINTHPGNQQFRSLVDAQKNQFMKAKNKVKRSIAAQVLSDIESLQPPGRFLVEVRSHNGTRRRRGSVASSRPSSPNVHPSLLKKTWLVVEREKALDKVMHRLRERVDVDTAAARPNQMNVEEEMSEEEDDVDDQYEETPTEQLTNHSASNTPNGVDDGDEDEVQVQVTSRGLPTEQLGFKMDGTSNSLSLHSGRVFGNTTSMEQLTSETSSIRNGAVPYAQVDFVADRQSLNDSCLDFNDESLVSNPNLHLDLESSQQSNSLSLHSGLDFDNTISMDHGTSKSSSIRDGTVPEGQVDSVADRQSLKDSYLYFNDESLVLGPNPHSQQIREYTLRQWIMTSKQDIDSRSNMRLQSSSDVAKYIKSTLLIALKLTDFILEAENVERQGLGNPIPLASIAPDNVVVRVRPKASQHAFGESNEELESIETVRIMSIVGDSSTTGTVMSRLFAMGKVLYELFSTLYELFSTIEPAVTDKPPVQMASVYSVNLGNDGADADDNHTQKKKHSLADDTNLNYVARLESIGIPWSLCALVKNLLECERDPFSDNDAYASFFDLQVDLQLMVDNPSCFLDNIHASNAQKVTILDKLYGRDEELLKLDKIYRSCIAGNTLIGAIISGGAGVGKSKLAMYMQKLTIQANQYFLSAKFEHDQMSLKPFSTIANLLDDMCEMLLSDSSHSQLMKIENDLMSALGSHTHLLGVVPNLRKLMPSCAPSTSSSPNWIDSSVSMRYLCGELLRVISLHSKPITIVIDDIQFADPASLLLVGNLLFKAQGAPIFFALCHRDDDASMNETLKEWLVSMAMYPLATIKLESITAEAVNNLISEALHLSPRLTRPLSFVLHRKTRGNPLFLRQLLDSLTEQGYIYFDMKQHRWAWDLDAITELEISESVLALLMDDIQRLPSDLQFGLQVAACIGSCVTEPMLNCLSRELGLDLKHILQQASEKGFMIDIAGSKMFRFAHDKIQEAVYELMPEQQRRENHMRFGLALCIQTMDDSVEDEELFFAAVNQINHGGPTAVHVPGQRNIIAQLNLKAGKRSIELSDYNSAFELLQHGISFLSDDHWLVSYQLSLDLYDAVAEAALVLTKLSAVTFYSNEVISRARCFDDKLHYAATYSGLCTYAKALGIVSRHQHKSVKSCFAILAQFGEDPPRAVGDDTLRADIDKMSYILQSTSDVVICNMQENIGKKMTTLIDLYATLAHLLQFFKPWLAVSVSLRMVELTMKFGLSTQSPLAFAHFGGNLLTEGRINEGCRLGKLALKLVEKKGSLRYKSSVFYFVYHNILWASEPMQSIVEAHLLGHKAGQQSGDIVYAFSNLLLAITDDYFSGLSFEVVQMNILDLLSKLQSQGVSLFYKTSILFLSQLMVLKEGLHMSAVTHVDNMPTEREILHDASSGPSITVYGKIHHLTRAFLFRQLDDSSLHVDISGAVAESHHQLSSHYLMGYFFEGLASFQLARQTSSSESANWIERGHSVLATIRFWSEHSRWNWENKVLLLEAESMFTNGKFDRAGPLYVNAIRSAREHKFIHEEAIASELAGMFYFERGFHHESSSCLLHSVDCYKKWGAHAVARRVESFIECSFGRDINQLVSSADASFGNLFVSSQGSRKKRQSGS